MALVDNAWYIDFGDGSTTGYFGVTKFAISTAYAAAALIRQLAAPSAGNERVFVCIVAGTSGGAEPAWTLTRGAKTTSGTATFQECTGIAALNGDLTHTPNWTTIKNTAITLGQVIQRDNGASYQICTTAGTAGNGAEPGFSDTAGTTTADNTVTWTSLGVVGNFTGWQAPHARMGNAFAATWGQNGNDFYVASEHAETRTTGQTLTPPSTFALPCRILCVDKTPVPPTAVTTGATYSISGANAMAIQGTSALWDGIDFSHSGAGLTITFSTSAHGTRYRNCNFALGTSASQSFVFNGDGQKVVFENCTFSFNGNTQAFAQTNNTSVWVVMKNCTVSFGAVTHPTNLFNAPPCVLELYGCDLSACNSGNLLSSNTQAFIASLVDCNLDAGAAITADANVLQRVNVIRSSPSNINYNHESYTGFGSQIVETTIVRGGGASDGTTPISWKIVTTADSSWECPFESLPIAIWNDTTGSNITVSVCGIWGGGAVPNNDDIWIEVEYLGGASDPQGTIKTITKADSLATGSALTSDSSSWGGSTTPFKMVATLSSPQPQKKGILSVTVKAAKASSTFYIDPLIVVT